MFVQSTKARVCIRICFNSFMNKYKHDLNYTTLRKLTSDTSEPIKMAFNYFEGDKTTTDQVPIILMHGLFGSKINWQSLGKAMAEKTQKKVYLVDARNHGDSPHSDKHTYFHLLEDVRYFMSNKNIEKAALIGHSMGGRAMMAMALKHQHKVESLTVVDISPVEKLTDMSVVFQAMNSIKPVVGDNLFNVQKLVEAQLREILVSEKLSRFLAMNFHETGAGNYNWKINLKSLIKNFTPHISIFPIKEGEFKGPVLFICGANSDFVNLEDTDKIKQFFPNAKFVTIENAGHWVHAEQPKRFLEVASEFINANKS